MKNKSFLSVVLFLSLLFVPLSSWAEENTNYFRLINRSASAQYCDSRKVQGSPLALQYKIKSTGTWATYTFGSTRPNVASGDTIYFRQLPSNASKHYVNSSASNYERFYLTSGDWKVEGDIMTLIYANTGETSITTSHALFYLFYGCTALKDASGLILPATTLSASCYAQLFEGCTALTLPPSCLPALEAMPSSYFKMFNGCKALQTAPTIAAVTLQENSCRQMFYGCTGLITAPEINATTVGVASCYQMFYGCTTLATAPNVLPAKVLYKQSYYQMFYNCSTALTTSPIIMAQTIPTPTASGEGALGTMFRFAKSLNYVQTRMKSWPDGSYSGTDTWLGDVATTGTFVCPSALNTSTRNATHVPSTWTIKYLPELTFDVATNGGTWDGSAVDDRLVDWDEQLVSWPMNPQKNDAEFIGWYDDPVAGNLITTSSEAIQITTEKKFITLYARFSGASVTYTFYKNGGLWVDGDESETKTKGVSFKAEHTFSSDLNTVKTGYSFVGWNTKADGSGVVISSPASLADEDQDVYAIYLPVFTFDVATNGGTWDGSDNTNKDKTKAELMESEIGSAQKVDYTFTGWQDQNGTPYPGASSLGETPTTYYAQFLPNLTFDPAGGKWSDESTSAKVITTAIDESPSRNGYHFDGWDNDYDPAQLPSTPTTFTAQWSMIDYTFNVNGGTWDGEATEDRTFTVVTIADVPTPQMTGYIFIGWTTDAEGAGDELDIEHLPSSATTYYAQFTRVKFFCIKAETDNVIVGTKQIGSPSPLPNILYSTDGGGHWANMTIGTSGTQIVLANAGDSVLFRGVNTYINQNSSHLSGLSVSSSPQGAYISFTATAGVSLSGNIMTLINGIHPTDVLPTGDFSCFGPLFAGMPVISAADLQLPTITSYGCYQYMFYNCTSLTIPPVLPAPIVERSAYCGMFSGCSNLTTAPVMMATNLSATSSSNGAAAYMFYNCANLNSVSVKFKSWTADATYYWLGRVAATGTFTCPSALPKTTGTSNIPTSWVVNYIPELTFNVVANGGHWTSGTDNLVLDTEQPLTELPVAYTDNVNQTFRGWNTVADGSGTWLTLDNQPVISTTAQRITYYAIYATDYTFDVATNNGTWDGTATEDRVFNDVELKIDGAPAAVHALGATQYAHVGWNTSASATTNSLDVDNLPAASTSFYAIFLPCYTFKLNGGIWSDGTLEDKIFTTFTSNPVATRNGYTFTRWNTMEDGTGEDFDWQSPTGTPTTYYAIWQDINYTFNLTAFPGTTWDGSDTQDRIYTGAQLLDMSAAMPVAENGDLQFFGWTTSPTGASNKFDKNHLPTTATTFYPVFKNYLCITALTNGVNIGTYFYGLISAGNIKAQYLRKEEDGGTGKWTQIYFNSRDKFVTLDEGQKVYIRGWNKSGINTENYTTNAYVKFCISKAAELSGNIMTLIDSINPPTTIPNEYCFAGLFRHNTGSSKEYSNIVKADKLQMPATATPQGAYESLFRACPLLTSAPDLSAARSVSMSSYKEMFLGCTSLLAMPAMPIVEEVAEGAYRGMFSGCTSLITTQELTARNLAREAYYEMFKKCTSLVNAPVIHAMSWTGSGAMAYMFMGCTALRRMEVKFRTWDAGETDATYTTYLWMDGTTTDPEDNAVFVCPGTLADCSRDASHIQLNWNLVVPEIIITHDCTTSGLSEMADVRILKGATLTLADNYRAKNITIHAGAKLTIPADRVLSCDSIFMRGGEVVDDTYYYIYPEMVVNGNIMGHDGEVTPIFYDYLINNAQNYTLCLPYDVECKEVTYAETGTPARFVVKYYDGAERVNGTEGETWKNLWYKWNPLDPETPSTILHAGQGYTVFGTPYTPLGQTYSYFRFPMHPDLRTLPEQPKTLNVFGYGCVGGKPIKPNNGANVGWNLVGNPYMAGFGNSWVSLLLNETKQLSYVILPNDEGTNYTTELLGDADMPAFKNFFIQVFEDAELDFNLSTRRQNAPARYAAAQEIERSFVGVSLTSDGGMTDRVGVAISDEYSEEYDAYADLTKWNNRDLNLCAEVGNNSLAMAAVSTSMAANSVPLRVAASEGGTFTFALHQPWCSNLDLFTHIYLMDVEEGAQVDLLSETYTYTAAAGSEEDRFYLMAVPRYTPTDLESATMMKTGVRKIMSNGTLFIIVGDKVFDVHGRVVNLR